MDKIAKTNRQQKYTRQNMENKDLEIRTPQTNVGDLR